MRTHVFVLAVLAAIVSAQPGLEPRTVLAFHGGGEGTGMARLTNLNAEAARRGVLLAYPDGLGRHWGDGRAQSPLAVPQGENDVVFVRAIIDDLTQHDRIAAIAIVAATMPISPACRPVAPLPMLLIHGDADPIIPASGGNEVGARGFAGPAESTTDTARYWAKVNHCAAAPTTAELPVKTQDGTRVSLTSWPGCPQSAVLYYDIIGGGHTWPGGPQYLPRLLIGRTTHNLDASATILDFFLRFPMAARMRTR
jgi:polyhydroxybutyrate depolymerase